MQESSVLARKDGRVIIHFDYDCFYASVVEHENPALKHCALAIQQKQIIVTCNYEARRQGLHKLQLISEAKKLCPDLVIVLGEDISRFRDASKELYQYLKGFSWNGKVERLGFDEVWLDVTDIVDYNLEILNRNALQASFFQLVKDDPTQGFDFDASTYAGYLFPEAPSTTETDPEDETLTLKLRLGSHLAMHMRHKLEDEKGYTSTVGIATSKLLSKLVGNLHKPMGQTTIVPPYTYRREQESNVTTFLDPFDIGKIPGIGFKLAQKLRESVLQRPPTFDKGLIYGGTMEKVTVRDVRLHPETSPEKLEKLLGGPGSPHGIGLKIWQLVHGVDDTEVSLARPVPRQISIEDSYIRLDTLPEVLRELTILSHSLLNRMRIDLLGEDDDDDDDNKNSNDNDNDAQGDRDPSPSTTKNLPTNNKKWLAHPRTIRLTTRPRSPLNPDGTRTRSFKRISHSAPLPTFVFSLSASIDALADKLVTDVLVPMFRRLHPEKAGWNLSLVNVGVTNMAETAGDSRTAKGRDIGHMFRRQEDVLRDFRVIDDVEDDDGVGDSLAAQAPGAVAASDSSLDPKDEIRDDPEQDLHGKNLVEDAEAVEDARWDAEDEDDDAGPRCEMCGASVPSFAMSAHIRYHAIGD